MNNLQKWAQTNLNDKVPDVNYKTTMKGRGLIATGKAVKHTRRNKDHWWKSENVR